MGMLAGHQIASLVEEGELGIEPFDPKLVQPASYDLRLNPKMLASPLSPDLLGRIVMLDEKSPSYEIQPGQMVGVLSMERMRFPVYIAARFGIRSDFARKGINAFGGLQLDPGWEGRLILNLLNVGPEPIPITMHEPLFSVEFQRLEEPTVGYKGPHQNQDDFSPDQVEYILSAHTTSLAEIPTFRRQIAQLSVLIEELADKLPDPDEGLRISRRLEERLKRTLGRPSDTLLTHRDMLDKLDLRE